MTGARLLIPPTGFGRRSHSVGCANSVERVLQPFVTHGQGVLTNRGGAVVDSDGTVLSMLHVHGADGVDVDIGLAPRWKGTLYGPPHWRQRLLWKLLSAIELRKQCRLLVPFLLRG